MPETFAIKYRAFLSYSHRDRDWARWLHRSLESYRIDRDLVGRHTRAGTIPKTLVPIFRDRDDFSAGPSLTEQTIATLEASDVLIVLCSPNAANSEYVNEEVRRFKLLGRADRVIPFIVDGTGPDAELECFPPALRFKVAADGSLTGEPEHPLAADARPDGDGRNIALQKVVAGLLGLGLDEIVRRADRARRRRTRIYAGLAGVFLVLSVTAIGSAIVAFRNLTKSEQRLDRAIEIAYSIVTEVTPTFDRYVPLEVTLRLLRNAETALNRLIEEGNNSPNLRYRRAQMLIAFSDSYMMLGQTAEARRRAEEANALLTALVASRPGNRAWQHDLLISHQKLGNALAEQGLLTRALEHYRASRAIADQLVAAEPDNREWQRDLSVAHIKIGDISRPFGKLSDALASYQAALAIRQTLAQSQPDNVRWQRDLASAHDRVGDVLSALGKLGEALTNYLACRDIIQRFQVAENDNPDWQRNLAVVIDKIGDVLRAQGRRAEALANYSQSRDLRARLAASDAKNARWQRDLALSYMKIGSAHVALGRLTEAGDSYHQGVAIIERLVKADPNNTTWQRDLATAYDSIGEVLRVRASLPGPQGQPGSTSDRPPPSQDSRALLTQAIRSYRLGLDIRLRLAAIEALNANLHYDVGVSHGHIGEALNALGELDEALKQYRAALEIFLRLVVADPTNAHWRYDLSVAYERIGDVLTLQRQTADALASYRKSLEVRSPLLTTDPDNIEWLLAMVRIWRSLARNGDDPPKYWALISASLQRLKTEWGISPDDDALLEEAQRQQAELHPH